MSFVGVITSSWVFWVHFVFTCLNSRNDYHLIRVWMKMTYEIPAKNDEDYRVIGLSREKNKAFWLKEDALNAHYGLLRHFPFAGCAIVLVMQLFFYR